MDIIKKIDELETLLIELVNDPMFEKLDIYDDVLNMQDKISEYFAEEVTINFQNTNVKGYIYNQGYHDGAKVFKGTYDNIANFIMLGEGKNIVITDDVDCLLVKTHGLFVDKAFNQDFTILLLDKLIPLQRGERELEAIEFINDYEMVL